MLHVPGLALRVKTRAAPPPRCHTPCCRWNTSAASTWPRHPAHTRRPPGIGAQEARSASARALGAAGRRQPLPQAAITHHLRAPAQRPHLSRPTRQHRPPHAQAPHPRWPPTRSHRSDLHADQHRRRTPWPAPSAAGSPPRRADESNCGSVRSGQRGPGSAGSGHRRRHSPQLPPTSHEETPLPPAHSHRIRPPPCRICGPTGSIAAESSPCRRATSEGPDGRARPDLPKEEERAPPPPSSQAARASGGPLGQRRGRTTRRWGAGAREPEPLESDRVL
jgi:hypothetical protein